jgi:hypothetical protein
MEKLHSENKELVKEIKSEKERAQKYYDLYKKLEAEQLANARQSKESITNLQEIIEQEKDKYKKLKMKYVGQKFHNLKNIMIT